MQRKNMTDLDQLSRDELIAEVKRLRASAECSRDHIVVGEDKAARIRARIEESREIGRAQKASLRAIRKSQEARLRYLREHLGVPHCGD
jgi:hypothetical protein